MKQPDFDPSTHTVSFNGSKWVRIKIPEQEPTPNEPTTYFEKRMRGFGTSEFQIEFITENGLEAWQTKVAEIKAKYPK